MSLKRSMSKILAGLMVFTSLNCIMLNGAYSQTTDVNKNVFSRMEASIENTFNIHGKVVLPNNEVAKEDMVLTVGISSYTYKYSSFSMQSLENKEELKRNERKERMRKKEKEFKSFSTTNNFDKTKEVVLKKGDSFVEYTIEDISSEDEYIVGYRLENSNDYYVGGFYCQNGMTYREDFASELSSKDSTKSFDMEVIPLTSISGEIKFPKGMENETAVKIDANDDHSIIKSTDIKIEKNQTSVQYAVYGLPRTLAGTGYYVGFDMGDNDLYMNKSYYNVTGTTCVSYYANTVDTSKGNVDGIDLTAIECRYINGSISLPDNEIASKDISLQMEGDNNAGWYYDDVTITGGNNKTTYSIKVPYQLGTTYSSDVAVESDDYTNENYIDIYDANQSISSKYYLSYSSDNIDTKYLDIGIYANGKTVIDLSSTNQVDVKNGNVKIEDFKIARAERTVSGIISLPEGVEAKSDMYVSVYVYVNGNNYYTARKFIISAGSNSVPFSMGVPSINGVKLSYWISNTEYIREGYYNIIGTKLKESEAAVLDLTSADISNLDFKIAKYERTVSGTLALPDNYSSKGYMYAYIYTDWDDGYNYEYITIPGGSSSVQFSIEAPSIDGVTLRYELSSSTELVREGYYNSKGTKLKKSEAEVLNLTTNNISDLNFKIDGTITSYDASRYIAGKISLQGTKAYTNYMFEVPANNTGYIASFNDGYSYGRKYSGEGYYSTKGVTDKTNAELVNVSDRSNFNVDMEIPVTGVVINGGSSQEMVTKTKKFTANKPVYWYSENVNVFTIDKNTGVATAVYEGEANIRAVNISIPSEYDYCNVKVAKVLSEAPDDEIPTTTITPTPTKTKKKGGGGGGGGFVPAASPTPSESTTTTQPNEKDKVKEGKKPLPDSAAHWAKDYINNLVEKKIVSGYPDGTFKPDNSITRAEAAAVIVKMLGLKEATDKKLSFADNNEIPDWAKGYVKTAVEKGFVNGYEDNTFKPSKQITRAEMAVMIMRALGKEKVEGNLPFADAGDILDWAKGYVAKASELKLINGYEDTTFKPSNSITRAEVSVIVSKALEIK